MYRSFILSIILHVTLIIAIVGLSVVSPPHKAPRPITPFTFTSIPGLPPGPRQDNTDITNAGGTKSQVPEAPTPLPVSTPAPPRPTPQLTPVATPQATPAVTA